MKKVYTVWHDKVCGFKWDIVEISGKINHYTVQLAVIKKLSVIDRENFSYLISWQEEDSFTGEEEKQFLKEYEKYEI